MKAHGKAAELFLDAPSKAVWAVLVHCEDEGVASEAARQLVARWGQAAPSERIVLTEDELARDPGLLFDRLEALSLLGDRPLLSLTISNEKLAPLLVEAVGAGERLKGDYEARLVVASGALKTASKLRKTFEEAQYCAALQLQPDTEEDLRDRVTMHLAAHGAQIEDLALSRFISGLPGHRRLALAEIEKLALYAHGLSRPISAEDVAQLAATDVDHALPALVSAVLTGHTGRGLAELDRLEHAGTSPISILRGVQREAERLLSAHAMNVRDPASAMKLRPPVWRDAWPDFKAALDIWNPPRLVRLLARIQECESLAKQAGPAASAVTRQMLTDMLRVSSA